MPTDLESQSRWPDEVPHKSLQQSKMAAELQEYFFDDEFIDFTANRT